MKRILSICALSFLVLGGNIFAQNMAFRVSGGACTVFISQGFTEGGQKTDFTYAAPGAFISAEFDIGGFFMEFPLGFVFAPYIKTLGGQNLDLSNYPVNNAADFALDIGYMFDIGGGMSVGAGGGLHVSGPWLEAPNDDPSMFNLIDYGLVGISLIARFRYSFMPNLGISVCVPIGIDLTYMNPDVVAGGANTGVTIPATVYPSSLTPDNTGFTAGLAITVEYMFSLQ
jgi:hypothetical protein